MDNTTGRNTIVTFGGGALHAVVCFLKHPLMNCEKHRKHLSQCTTRIHRKVIVYISGIYLCPLRTREASRRIARLHWKPQIRCIDSGRGMLDVLYVQRDWFAQHRTEAADRRAMKPTCQERTHTLHRHRTECTHTPWLLLHQGQGVQYLPGRAPHHHLPPPPIHERTKRESR